MQLHEIGNSPLVQVNARVMSYVEGFCETLPSGASVCQKIFCETLPSGASVCQSLEACEHCPNQERQLECGTMCYSFLPSRAFVLYKASDENCFNTAGTLVAKVVRGGVTSILECITLCAKKPVAISALSFFWVGKAVFWDRNLAGSARELIDVGKWSICPSISYTYAGIPGCLACCGASQWADKKLGPRS